MRRQRPMPEDRDQAAAAAATSGRSAATPTTPATTAAAPALRHAPAWTAGRSLPAHVCPDHIYGRRGARHPQLPESQSGRMRAGGADHDQRADRVQGRDQHGLPGFRGLAGWPCAERPPRWPAHRRPAVRGGDHFRRGGGLCEFMHGHGGEVLAELHPRFAAIGADERAELGAAIEQIAIDHIFAETAGAADRGKIADDVCLGANNSLSWA